MVTYSFLFFVVFLIGLLDLFSGQAVTVVVPGWHTTIYPPWFFVKALQLLWLGIAAGVYYFVERQGRVVQRRYFFLHLAFSLTLFFDNSAVLFGDYDLTKILIIAPLVLFLLGQVVFILGLLKANRTVAP